MPPKKRMFRSLTPDARNKRVKHNTSVRRSDASKRSCVIEKKVEKSMDICVSKSGEHPAPDVRKASEIERTDRSTGEEMQECSPTNHDRRA